MSESSKRIWVEDGLVLTHLSARSNPVSYVRTDLVERLLAYSGHMGSCEFWNNEEGTLNGWNCTCGLDSLIKEVRG